MLLYNEHVHIYIKEIISQNREIGKTACIFRFNTAKLFKETISNNTTENN